MNDEDLPPLLTTRGVIATITLRRPRRANRLTPDDLLVLQAQIAEVNAQPALLVLRLMAQGRHFCSGYDIASIGGADAGDAGATFALLADALEAARPVTIAAIQGGVYGGATDLALACDFRLGTPACEMFVPAARLGLHFYRSGLERYVSRLVLAVAKRVMLAGETLDAQAMRDCGFLDRLVAPDALMSEGYALSATLAGMAPLALLGMKASLNRIARGVESDATERAIAAAAQSQDLREGTLVWQEKRAPQFSGR